MNEEQIINQLQLLKTIQPKKSVLQEIKQGVYQRVGVKLKPPTSFNTRERLALIFRLIKSYNIAFYGLAFVLLAIIFLSFSAVIWPKPFHTAMLYSRLTFASNQYQKAQIALSDTTSMFADKKLVLTHTQDLSRSLALTNTELSKLKLKGEKGKYTSQECRQVYEAYLTFLKNKEKNISESDPSFTSLHFQIHAYEEQAEKKLHLYNSL